LTLLLYFTTVLSYLGDRL